MVKGIIVPSATRLPLQKAEFHKLADFQSTVGGHIEMVKLDGHPLVVVADEDGKTKQLPVNRRATNLRWLFNPSQLGRDFLVGDVVILGAQRAGDVKDIPATLVVLLLGSRTLQVEVCLSPALDSWVPIGGQVNDFFEATTRALKLMEVWDPPEQVRVVRAS